MNSSTIAIATNSSKWIEQQRSKPSFVVAGRDHDDVLFEKTLNQMPSSLLSVSSPFAIPSSSSPASSFGANRPMPSQSPAAKVLRASTPIASGRATTPKGTQSATANGGVPIHEQLIERGKLYEQRQEALRQEAIQKELRRCRSVPRVSKMARDIKRVVQQPDGSEVPTKITDRLAAVFKEKSEREFFDLQKLELKEKEILSRWFHPTISAKGRKASGKAQKERQKKIHETWEFKRQLRIEELRNEKVRKEVAELREAPDIDKKSELLAARRREKEGMAGYSHLEAMIERDRLAKLARWEEQQRQLMYSAPASPRITEYAATLHRPQSVVERLMEEGEAREQRRRERERHTLEEERSKVVGNMNPSLKFHPDELLQRQQQQQQRRDERLQAIVEAEKRQHTPQINPTSDHIAARLPTSTMERLTQTPTRSQTPSNSLISQQSPIRTRTPNPTSSLRQDAEDSKLFERMQLAEARRKLKIDAARAEQEAKALGECSFAPQTTTHYYPPTQQRGVGTSTSNGAEGVYDRMQQWQQKRDERLEQQRRQDEEQTLKEATFTPTIYRNPNASLGPASQLSVSGYDDFIQRQTASRLAKEDRAGQQGTQSPARRGTTTPQAPLLGKEREVARQQTPVVLSLQRPVSVPVPLADHLPTSSARYSFVPQQQRLAAEATPLAQHFLHSARGGRRDDNGMNIPHALDTLSFDTDEFAS